ncbi:MAG: CRTAC1 family protein [Phycisphaerales bacterium]
MPFSVHLQSLSLCSLTLLASSHTSATAGPDTPTLQFVERTIEAGLQSHNAFHSAQTYTIMAGSGLAADFNNDGYDDIFHLGSMNPNSLFINNTDGTFSNQAQSWGVAGPFHSWAASAADFNNDGFIDIYITAFGSADQAPTHGQHLLMKNNGPDSKGQWSFTDVAVEAGVNHLLPGTTFKEGTGSGWGDYDLDGDLDLFVCGYSAIRSANRLYRNDGPDTNGIWRFTDVTAQAGVEDMSVSGFLPSFIDLNNDRYPELVIVGDTGTTRLFVNNHDGTFINATSTVEDIQTANAMGIDIADIDNDGLLDFFISNITFDNTGGPGNIMLMQNPDGSFENKARQAETHDGHWGWGSLINDFDHDGDKDILETNGYLFGFAGDPVTLFLNDGDGSSFTESAEACGIDHVSQGRGLVRLDADNDGDIDAILFNWTQQSAFYRNDLITPKTSQNNTHWARIKLDTYARDSLAPQGIGAMVTVSTDEESYILPIHNNTTYAGTSPVEAHIGLADNQLIKSIQIAWPDGSYDTHTNLQADQIFTFRASAFAADYNQNDSVEFQDVLDFASLLKNRNLSADHNGDGRLNYFDIVSFINDYRIALSP